jgi:HEAT repeat protein
MQGSTLERDQQQLQSANVETRRQAAEQLGQVKDGRAVEVLVMALSGGERDLSVWYAVAQIIEALGRVLNDSHTESTVRQAAAKALGVI